MPSHTHEGLVELFRNRPSLAAELLAMALHVHVQSYAEARVETIDLNELQPAEYRADLVVVLRQIDPVLGIVVEVQLDPDDRKRFSWPAYCVNFRARMRCPTCLLVITPSEHVAKWAAKPIALGGGHVFTPFVIGPSGVPVITEVERAKSGPELAVLSAIAHGHDRDAEKASEIAAAALTACLDLDPDHSLLYAELIALSLSNAARKALQTMDPAKYEYQSEFAKRYIAEGIEKGIEKGRADGQANLVLKQLTLRFGPLSEEVVARVHAARSEELECFAERVLTATTVDEVLA